MWRFGSSNTGSVSNIRSKKVGIGTDTPSEKLHVEGNILATGTITTTKVIFSAAGWSLEQVGTELQMKHNGVTKQKFLNDGSIAATGELTAYVAGASGYSEFLPLSGGTLTGNLNINATLTATTMKVGSNDVLHKGNIGSAGITSIGLGNGWTIEQTATNLYIKKNGVIKGTFNA